MKTLKIALIACCLGVSAAYAGPATESTIKELLEIGNTRQLVEGARGQIDGIMNKSVERALDGRKPSSKQQQAIDNMKNKMAKLMKEELSWEKLEPMYTRLYRESFTEEEMAGMLAFYKTPAGQAVINKMPVLMEKTMVETQKMMAATIPGMKQIQDEFIAELKAASTEDKKSGTDDKK